MTRTRARFSRSEKRLVVVSTLAIALVGGVGWWRAKFASVPNVVVPTPVLPTPNAYNFYVRALAATSAPRHWYFDTELDGEITAGPKFAARLQKQNALLQRNAPSLVIARQGFAFPYCQPPTRKWQDPDRTTRKLHTLAALCALQSRVQGAQGDWNGAAQSALDAMHVGYDLPHGGPMHAMFDGLRAHSYGWRELWHVLPHLNAAQLRRTGQRLEQLRSREMTFAQTLQEEKWAQQSALLDVMQRVGWERAIYSYAPPAVARPFALAINNRLVMQNYSATMDNCIAQARRPYAQQRFPAPPALSWQDPVSLTLIANLDYRRFVATSASAKDALLLTAFALRAYKLEHNIYPSALSQLVPAYLKAVPRDPFGNGEALHYAPTPKRYLVVLIAPPSLSGRLLVGGPLGSGLPGQDRERFGPPAPVWESLPYTLYSFGPDAKNDNGQPIKIKNLLVISSSEQRQSQPQWSVAFDSHGDMVAGLNR